MYLTISPSRLACNHSSSLDASSVHSYSFSTLLASGFVVSSSCIAAAYLEASKFDCRTEAASTGPIACSLILGTSQGFSIASSLDASGGS